MCFYVFLGGCNFELYSVCVVMCDFNLISILMKSTATCVAWPGIGICCAFAVVTDTILLPALSDVVIDRILFCACVLLTGISGSCDGCDCDLEESLLLGDVCGAYIW